jgi:hypothetical protein
MVLLARQLAAAGRSGPPDVASAVTALAANGLTNAWRVGRTLPVPVAKGNCTVFMTKAT